MILAEEWHTVDAVLHIDWLLRRQGVVVLAKSVLCGLHHEYSMATPSVA